jgi:hypothetical protein
MNNYVAIPAVEKSYTTPFLLDKAKAARVVEVLEERFHCIGLDCEPLYFIELERGNRLSFNRIEEVFALDNTMRNPIKILRIEAKSKDMARTSGIECSISFEIPSDSDSNNIAIRVYSSDSKLALQTFAAIEEQVQRTFVEDWVYLFKGGFPFFLLFFLLVGAFYILRVNPNKFTDQQLRSFLIEAKVAKEPDEKINFLFAIARREIENENASRVKQFLPSLLSIKALSMIVPICIVIVCTIYVLEVCYPRGVFLWGDYESYYNRLVNRRSAVFSVVILSVILGLITNFFAMGLASYLKFE